MTDDPYAWNPPETPRETWSDADWLRAEARANFVTEDIERADKIARMLDGMAASIAVMRTDLDMLADAVVADVAAELKHVKAERDALAERLRCERSDTAAARKLCKNANDELADLKRQFRIVEEAVSMCVGRDNRYDLSAYLDRRGVTAIKI
jgi:hypothetical protein